ncbi:Chemotaxis protein CheC -- inhibitor of MCP methylation [Marinobacterium lacunae]|uniref:Chemotaxis protein CheC--inhibitor of MCP methylation n=1 Tax=Marinobacterium lacunae TaxID=1232683 RepID=A0A081G4P8_9GAMM|nr:response regulator [Marinobacterium lacunae]KEA65753.1 Chemotaxis protein CheC -- inhibitor of MCP methylation [Marinobacterium lacunae]
MSAPIPVLICDDSAFARKQMIRALSEWNVSITEASHGLEALEAIRAGKGHLLFLDLNMPILDGYQVLERIRAQDLQTLVIVVSGDVQSEAKSRVLGLGALGFINKPIDAKLLQQSLAEYGLADELEKRQSAQPKAQGSSAPSFDELYQELSNVAMGRAGALLSELLGVFIHLPVPKVRMCASDDIAALLEQLRIESDSSGTLCQGFIGPGIAGEALLIFDQHSMEDMARLMKVEGDLTPSHQREMLLDVSNVLISAYLGELGRQLDIEFSQGVPVILGQHYHLPDPGTLKRWKRTLSIEVGYRIEGFDISCNLLLLFTDDSINALNDIARYL